MSLSRDRYGFGSRKDALGALAREVAPLDQLPTPEAADALAKARAEAEHRRTDGFAVSLGPFERAKPREKVPRPPRPPPLLDVGDWGEQLLAHVIVREGVTDDAGGAGVRADADAPLEKGEVFGGGSGGGGDAGGGAGLAAPPVGAPRLAAYERDAPFRGDVKSNASARRRRAATDALEAENKRVARLVARARPDVPTAREAARRAAQGAPRSLGDAKKRRDERQRALENAKIERALKSIYRGEARLAEHKVRRARERARAIRQRARRARRRG